MTNVFVSYARADKERVGRIVAFIESVVGEVWWDDRLVAGESFTDEVERRLNEADYVVVVWSPASSRSKWVMDEAAVGRDAGKLLPVCLDGQNPPLGFRHVHSTDFSGWDGSPDAKCARALRDALTRTPGEARPAARVATHAAPSPGSRRRLLTLAGAALAVLFVAVATVQFGPWKLPWSTRSSIAVLPFTDLDAQPERAYFGEGLAEEIRSALARNAALTVIGSLSSAKFASRNLNLDDVRRALGVDHVLAGSLRSVGGRIKLNVELLRTADGSRIWGEQYDRSAYDVFAIENEIGKAVSERLAGNTDAVAVASTSSVSALDLLLEARQLLRKRTPEDALKARGLLERAVALDPGSAAILGALAEAVWWTVNADFLRDQRDDPNKARDLAQKAILLAPDRADGYAALSLILSDEPTARRPILEKAVALDPSRSDLRMWLMSDERDPQKFIEGLKTVIALDPLWHVPVRNLVKTLCELHRYDEAERVIAEYAVRAPEDVAGVVLIRSDIAEARGDLADSYEASAVVRPQNSDTRFARARALAILGMDEQAARLLPTMEIPPEAWVRREPDALFRLSDAIPQFLAAIPYELFADKQRDDLLLRLFENKLGSADAFCGKIADFGVTRGAPSLVWALEKASRQDEAKTVAACARAELQKGTASGTDAGYSHFYIAQLDALAGDRSSAMSHLRKALALNYHGNAYSLDFREYRAFDVMQDMTEFRAIQKRIDAEAARQRAEIQRYDREVAGSAPEVPAS